MARETIFLVQSFRAGKGVRLIDETPLRCKTAEAARRSAERLERAKAGVIAFSTSGDPELGEYDEEPVVFYKAGRLPARFADN